MVPDWLIQLREFISQPWPWWVAGLMIALIMFLLLWFGKNFGMSENFRIMCAADGADDVNEFFKINWRDQEWNLLVALGAVFGGYMASHYFAAPDGAIAHVSAATVESLRGLGLQFENNQVPLVPDWYSWESIFSWRGVLMIIGGGFLVGFGARYAGGCTSGHAISGLSALELPSLVSVLGFFAGGMTMTYLIFPLIFGH
ncbi:MAG: YeeE/YedE family protein [Lewinellaceae bacterium]|nr:YeeE/YedE family protein [Saprospiraceae bacterium]MCB9334008.1 YeeE/YedE family protein [Lewinellaceae bacterium]